MKRMKAAYYLNIAIAVMTALAAVWMMTGLFTPEEVSLAGKGGQALKYFTVESNLLMGLTALVLAIYEGRYLSGRLSEIPDWLHKLNFLSTAAVALTFLVVVVFLAPNMKGGLKALLSYANFFFHLLIPVLSIIKYIVLESRQSFRFKDSLWGLLPMALYCVFYAANALSHAEADGSVSKKYDWYGFLAKGGVKSAVPAIAIMFLGTLAICCCIWALGRLYLKRTSALEQSKSGE